MDKGLGYDKSDSTVLQFQSSVYQLHGGVETHLAALGELFDLTSIFHPTGGVPVLWLSRRLESALIVDKVGEHCHKG